MGKIKFNEKGMSLVEVIIAAGLMGAIALFGSKMFGYFNKGAKSLDHQVEINSIINEVRSILGNRSSCEYSFVDNNSTINTAPGAITEIIQKVPGESDPTKDKKKRFLINQPYGNSRIKIDSYRLAMETGVNAEIKTVAGATYGQTNLIVRFDKGDGSASVRYVERKVPLNIAIEPVEAANGSIAVADKKFVTCRHGSKIEEVIRSQHALYIHSNITNNGNKGSEKVKCPARFKDWMAHGWWQHSAAPESIHSVTTCYNKEGDCFTMYIYGKDVSSTPACPDGWTDPADISNPSNISSWVLHADSPEYRQYIRSCYKCPN